MEDVTNMEMQGEMAAVRRGTGRTQADFWTSFGTTQSGGARYEGGRPLPRPLQMLIWLWRTGRISDSDLTEAVRATNARTRCRDGNGGPTDEKSQDIRR